MSVDGGPVIGIDGGATRTRVVLADGAGEVLGRIEGGGSLLGEGDASDRQVAEGLAEKVGRLVAEADRELPVDTLCAGLAGAAGRPAAARRLEGRLVDRGVTRRARVVSDSEIALVDAFGRSEGMLLIAGTGSIALGRPAGGDPIRIGGWGALLGDEGSGYGLGLDGLRAAVRGLEERGPPTELSTTLFERLELGSIQEVLDWARREGKGGVASLAPEVAAAARRGDPVAEEIVDRGVAELAAHARALARRLGRDRLPPVAFVGGLIGPGGPLRDGLSSALAADGFPLHSDPVEPTRGAIRMALEM